MASDNDADRSIAADGVRRLFTGEQNVATVVVDANGTITYFGPNAEAMTGFSSNDIVGRDLRVVSGSPRPLDTREYLARDPGDTPEFRRLRRADGETRAVQVYRHPIPRPSGLPDTLLLVVDVADNSGSNVGLGLLNAFFQQSTFGFVILDTQLRFLALNEAMARINHRPLIDHLGKHMSEVLNSTDLDTYESLLQSVLRTAEPMTNLHLSGYPTSAPGNYRVYSVSFYRFSDSNDRPLGLCGLTMDITNSEPNVLEAARGRARLSLLNEISASQINTLDCRQAAHQLTEVLIKDFCDMAVVDVLHNVVSGEQPPEQPTMDTLVNRIGGAVREPTDLTDALLSVDNPRPASETDMFAHALNSKSPQRIDNPRVEQPTDSAPISQRERAIRRVTPRSVIVAPLRARDIILGALTFVRFGQRDPFTDEETLLASEIADRTALGIDNARLYAIEQQAALTLQRNLLPAQPPKLAQVDLTYRYRPSRADQRAGGDWFDTILLPGKRVALVVGDVAGHGIASAAVMGHYRTALRTLASIGLEPSILLTRLNDLAFEFGGEITATCVLAVYDPDNHTCTIAGAGHPPPIVAAADGTVDIRELDFGPLLGVVPGARYRAAVIDTPPQTRLLLYSDGIVESRQQSLDRGIAELARRLRTHHRDEEVCDRILAGSPSTEDDRTVLLARFHGLRM